jgi:hypothetical protein
MKGASVGFGVQPGTFCRTSTFFVCGASIQGKATINLNLNTAKARNVTYNSVHSIAKFRFVHNCRLQSGNIKHRADIPPQFCENFVVGQDLRKGSCGKKGPTGNSIKI